MPLDNKRVIFTHEGRKFLRNLRIQKGLPINFQKNYAAIIHWENGRGNATLKLFQEYISKFKLTLDYFNKNKFIKEIAPSAQEIATLKMTKVPSEYHDKIIQDYKNGLTLNEISKQYNCHFVTIFYILKKYNIDTSKHGSGENYHFPESEYIHDIQKKGINRQDALPLISALLFTDGCLCKTKKQLETSYYGYDETLHKIFADLIWYCFKIRPSSYMIRCGKVFRTKYINKDFARKMLSLSPSYKTKPAPKQNWSNFMNEPHKPSLTFLRNYNSDIAKEVIRLAMCADGCIAVSKKQKGVFFTLILSCSHPRLVKEWAELFSRAGIKNNVVKGSGRTGIGGVKGIGDCLFKFNEIGGFIGGVKVCVRCSPLWGIEKQKILSNAVSLLNKDKRINTLNLDFEKFKTLL